MLTDQRTGMRSIIAARETFAAVALVCLFIGTILRCVAARPGGFAGAILTIMALVILSRYRVSWDQRGICYQTPFGSKRKPWAELSSYKIEPQPDLYGLPLRRTSERGLFLFEPCRLRLSFQRSAWTIDLRPYSWQDIRHLTDRVSTEVPQHEDRAATLS